MRRIMGMLRIGLSVLAGLVLLSGCSLFSGIEAVIDVSTLSGVVPLTISFDGSASTASGGIVSYRWSTGAGTEVYGASGSYTYDTAGQFDLTLIVRGADGRTSTTVVQIDVAPAFWVADKNLDQVYRLDSEGAVLDTFDVPRAEPRGLALANTGAGLRLLVACYGDGNQRIVEMDPQTGVVIDEWIAPAQSPLYLTYGGLEPLRVWHVDGVSRKLYELTRQSGQVLGSFGLNYFRATRQIGDVAFLYSPVGIAWTSRPGDAGTIWYLEGETGLLYPIEIVPAYDLLSGLQLESKAPPLAIDETVFPVAGMDWYDGYLWVVAQDHHQIVQIDPATGLRTGVALTGFPGAATSGLAIQK